MNEEPRANLARGRQLISSAAFWPVCAVTCAGPNLMWTAVIGFNGLNQRLAMVVGILVYAGFFWAVEMRWARGASGIGWLRRAVKIRAVGAAIAMGLAALAHEFPGDGFEEAWFAASVIDWLPGTLAVGLVGRAFTCGMDAFGDREILATTLVQGTFVAVEIGVIALGLCVIAALRGRFRLSRPWVIGRCRHGSLSDQAGD